jgi:hypothetical protein
MSIDRLMQCFVDGLDLEAEARAMNAPRQAVLKSLYDYLKGMIKAHPGARADEFAGVFAMALADYAMLFSDRAAVIATIKENVETAVTTPVIDNRYFAPVASQRHGAGSRERDGGEVIAEARRVPGGREPGLQRSRAMVTGSQPPPMCLGFKFLSSPMLRTVAVLEVRTSAGEPIRIGFDRLHLEELARAAGVAAGKLDHL